jgi:hypothetical protein
MEDIDGLFDDDVLEESKTSDTLCPLRPPATRSGCASRFILVLWAVFDTRKMSMKSGYLGKE